MFNDVDHPNITLSDWHWSTNSDQRRLLHGTLIHQCGSQCIVTRTPPDELRWIKASPPNGKAAIEFARKRQIDEPLSPIGT